MISNRGCHDSKGAIAQVRLKHGARSARVCAVVASPHCARGFWQNKDPPENPADHGGSAGNRTQVRNPARLPLRANRKQRRLNRNRPNQDVAGWVPFAGAVGRAQLKRGGALLFAHGGRAAELVTAELFVGRGEQRAREGLEGERATIAAN